MSPTLLLLLHGGQLKSEKSIIPLLVFLILLGLLLLFYYWQRFARRRFVEKVKKMAVEGRYEINGRSGEDWVEILNKDAAETLGAIDSVVLIYRGQEFLFVHGAVAYVIYGSRHPHCTTMDCCFLIAIGDPAVRLLSSDERVFRRITGSAELAAFSIYHWSDFLAMLKADRCEREV